MPWRHMDFAALRAEAEAKKALLAQAQLVTGPSVYCNPSKYIFEAPCLDLGRDAPDGMEQLLDLMYHV